jgi:predicted SAM-dependent methyltransferase
LLRLHLGCGSNVVPGWENIDKSPNVRIGRIPGLRAVLARLGALTSAQASAQFPAGIVPADVLAGLKYPDASVSHVYTSHMIEHMARWQAHDLLRECHRVLVPGGVLRIATPDLAAIVQAYLDGVAEDGPTPADHFMHHMLTFREERENPVRRVARRLVTAPHQWVYDAESLGHLLVEAGFSKVVTRTFREADFPELDRLEIREDSLFMQGTRP